MAFFFDFFLFFENLLSYIHTNREKITSHIFKEWRKLRLQLTDDLIILDMLWHGHETMGMNPI